MPLTRREFLKGIGATVGGIGLASASFEHLIPFVEQPNDIVPGVSTWYATSCRECPAGCSMIVRNRDAHVVKCEGNPRSPVNAGKLCARGQAALHGLYDPDRIKSPMRKTGIGKYADTTWEKALQQIGRGLSQHPRIAFLTDLQTGTFESLSRTWLSSFGSTRYVVYEPISYESVKAVSGGVVPTYNIDKSDYLISFGADFLETWISPVEYARKFAAMRTLRDGKRGKFVYVGPRISMTAANADRRIIVPPEAAEQVARTIMSGGAPSGDISTKYGVDTSEMGDIARELAAAKSPLALPGLDPDMAHAARLVNSTLGSHLIDTSRPHALTGTSSASDINSLISDMDAGNIDVLIVYKANPAYSFPQSDKFIRAMEHVPTVISLSSCMDETSAHADWILPSNTPLESWGDYRPYPDIANLMQPTMGTLFDTRDAGDILIELAKRAGIDPMKAFKASSFHEYLRQHWGFPLSSTGTSAQIVSGWESLMQQGGRWSGAATSFSTVKPVSAAPLPTKYMPASENEIRLWAFPHTYLYDGRNANRRWLQEIPEPVTNAVWGTWAEIHPTTAKRLGISTDDIVEISYKDVKIRVPAIVWEGVALDTVAVPIGQGHVKYGRFASGIGVNVFPLLATSNLPVNVRRTGETKWASRIKGSDKQHGREIIQTASLSEPLRREEEIIFPMITGYGKKDFYPGHKYTKHRWAMTVDLDRCIGCHACVAACYAENNLAVVGPDEIWRRREMSWIRIDRYTDWSDPYPILFQPMLCQHCDAAPCEPVCPVFASAHDEEGLNMQIYNRCVGTRYCSHNCPYKVRRFNWFDYEWPSPLHYQLNPDVTVRSRGVMEKCTFCIQRIREAEMNALREKRAVRDGEITPACVQTCPTKVFTFGDLKDPNSEVSKIIRADPRAYQVLRELNTKPAVIYLKRVVDK